MYDYILKSKKIVTLDDKMPIASWIGVRDGLIVKVAAGQAVPQGEKLMDLGEATVLPGLMDSHVHAGMTAMLTPGVNLIEATSVKEVLDLIDKRCRNTDEELVLAPFFVPQQIKEKRFPTRRELDGVSHGKKIMVISITLHASSVNTKAYEFLDMKEPMEGMIFEDGEFTGEFTSDDAQFFAMGTLLGGLSEEQYIDRINYFGRLCCEYGLTTVHCLEGQFVKDDKDIDIWLKLIEEGQLPFHCVLYPQVWDYDKIEAYGLPRMGGCLTLDGSDMDHTMALLEPYTCNPETRGTLFHSDTEVYNLVVKAQRDDRQIGFHCLGDRAIEQALYIFRQVNMEYGDKHLRHRIEHFTLPTKEHIKMAKDLGIIATQQPEFTYLFDYPGGPIEEVFGSERAKRMEMYKEVSDAGITVAGGSDSPVNSLNPLSGIHALVNAPKEGRRFDITDAIKVYTQNIAYTAFEENERGTIREGFFADFTALKEDPYEVPDKINKIKVAATIVEGEVKYRADEGE